MSESPANNQPKFGPLRRRLVRPFLRVNESIWSRLPPSWKTTRLMSSYGGFLNSLVRSTADRTQFHGTFFMRNRAEIEMIRSIALERPPDSTLKLTVLACSNGAEVYSILSGIRSARPDLKLDVHAIDISPDIIEVAKQGLYSPEKTSLVGENIFERLTKGEVSELFNQENGKFRIKEWIAQGINWRVGDAGDSMLAESLGAADIVVANKFLCHMQPSKAEACLRELVAFLKAGGYLLVSGVDLDVRTKVALDLGWKPVTNLVAEIHDGDPSVRRDWPWRYWGLEPLDVKRKDWKTRYAAFFQVGSPLTERQQASALEDSVAHSA
jgi:chemotaxis methyl-accepting protein methylase